MPSEIFEVLSSGMGSGPEVEAETFMEWNAWGRPSTCEEFTALLEAA